MCVYGIVDRLIGGRISTHGRMQALILLSLCVVTLNGLRRAPLTMLAGVAGPRRGRATEGDGRDERGQLRFVHKTTVNESTASLGLLNFAVSVFPGVKRSQAKQWLTHNALCVNDEVQTKFDYALYPGDTVLVRAGKSSLTTKSSKGSSPAATALLQGGISIVFEDDALIVLEKPANMTLFVPSSSKEEASSKSAQALVNAYLGKKKQKALVVHQMDSEASGVAIFAKTVTAKEFLQKRWSTFGRTFAVVCRGFLAPAQGSWTTFQDESASLVKCHSSKPSVPNIATVYKATTHYRTLECIGQGSNVVSLVEVSLETNRKDQIRSQFALFQHPILGDTVYSTPQEASSGRRENRRLNMHSTQLRIDHPQTLESITFSSSIPSSFFAALQGDNIVVPRGSSSVGSVQFMNKQIKVVPLSEWLGQGTGKEDDKKR